MTICTFSCSSSPYGANTGSSSDHVFNSRKSARYSDHKGSSVSISNKQSIDSAIFHGPFNQQSLDFIQPTLFRSRACSTFHLRSTSSQETDDMNASLGSCSVIGVGVRVLLSYCSSPHTPGFGVESRVNISGLSVGVHDAVGRGRGFKGESAMARDAFEEWGLSKLDRSDLQLVEPPRRPSRSSRT